MEKVKTRPTTRNGRYRKTEEHAARRQAMREKLWTKVDYVLDLMDVGCPKNCSSEHAHRPGMSPRDVKELSIAFGVLLDKYRLETGDGKAGSGADIDDYLNWLGTESKPPRSRDVKKATKKVDAKALH